MKKTTIIFLLLCFFLAPSVLPAQPMINGNEFYTEGDVISMVNCDPGSVLAGAAGANVTWDFTGLHQTGGLVTTTVLHDTSSVFLTSNLMIILPNGNMEYMQENSTDSYINGIYDNAYSTTTYYFNYDAAKRPFTYNTVFVDTYRVSVPPVATIGTGEIMETGDAYGTLKLPTGTFNNVLRIRKFQTETDTTTAGKVTTFSVSYLWFDTAHSAPLFRMDSITSIAGITQDAMYLSIPTGLKTLSSSPNNYTAWINNNELMLKGSFANGTAYEVAVYSIIGTKLFDEEFIAWNNAPKMDMGNSVSPGIYFVSIRSREYPADQGIVKVVKQ